MSGAITVSFDRKSRLGYSQLDERTWRTLRDFFRPLKRRPPHAAMVAQSDAATRNLSTEANKLSNLNSFFNAGAPPPARKAIAAASPQPAKIQPRVVRGATQNSPVSLAGGRRAATALVEAPQSSPDEGRRNFGADRETGKEND